MIVAAFCAGLALAVWRSRRERLEPAVMYDLAIWILVGGIVGARLLYVGEYWGETVQRFSDVFRIWQGGLVLYGSVFGAAAGFAAFRASRRFPVLATLDALAPSVALGVGLGRIGCFLNGCCYGAFCEMPWLGFKFPRDTPPWVSQRARGLIAASAERTLPVHPTQLYMALSGLVIFSLLTAYYPLRRRDGEVFGLLALTYPLTQLMVEFLRDDEGAYLYGLTFAQVISLGLLAVAAAFRTWLATRPRCEVAKGLS
jgi:phosphatidylglycerol:prolipoprotein diacylglycerol transferase